MLYTFFFPSNLLLSSLYFSRSLQLPPFRNSRQPLGRIAGTPPSPLPATVRAFGLYREKSS